MPADLTHSERKARETKAGFWLDKTIVTFFDETLASRPDAEYLIAYRSDDPEPVTLSLSDLSLQVSRIAANLGTLGVEHGDTVSFQIPNWWQFVAIHLACVRIGAISNPLMPILREREVEFIVRHSGSRILITAKTFRGFDHENLAQHILQRVSTLEHIIIIDSDGDDSFEAVLLQPGAPGASFKQIALKPNDIVKLMYTSGTTGAPKGVMHSSNTVLTSMKTLSNRLKLTEDDVIFMPSPFAHSIGFCYGIMLSIYLGARLVTMDIWNPAQAADIIERHGVTFMFGATPFLADIANLPDVERRTFDRLRLFLTAGAPVPPSLVDRATSALDTSVVPGYGMTELGLVTTTLPSDPDRGRITDGLVLPHAELRVVDENNLEVPRGSEGELQCRGSSTFVGYHGHTDLNEICGQGWFATGDLVKMDEDGYISIVGRSKDIIIRGGENIPVVEVENLILEMPQVNEVAIVGMPSERLGERSCAFASLHRDQELTLEQLKGFLDSRNLARQYMPEKLLIIERMPRTPVGKVQKFRLREKLERSHRA